MIIQYILLYRGDFHESCLYMIVVRRLLRGRLLSLTKELQVCKCTDALSTHLFPVSYRLFISISIFLLPDFAGYNPISGLPHGVIVNYVLSYYVNSE